MPNLDLPLRIARAQLRAAARLRLKRRARRRREPVTAIRARRGEAAL